MAGTIFRIQEMASTLQIELQFLNLLIQLFGINLHNFNFQPKKIFLEARLSVRAHLSKFEKS